jgi:hypothetical protein
VEDITGNNTAVEDNIEEDIQSHDNDFDNTNDDYEKLF